MVHLVTEVFGAPASVSASVWKDGGTWGFDSVEDFVVDINPEDSKVTFFYKSSTFQKRVTIRQLNRFGWSIYGSAKAEILKFEQNADSIVEQYIVLKQAAPPPAPPPVVVFIGHGRSPDWRDLKDHLADKHGIRVEAYETGARAGHSIRDVLEQMLRKSSLAVLVHTPEDELAAGTFNPRPNVIHETGLFQGHLGFARAIVLLKENTQEFSNLIGVQQIRYADIRQTFGDVLAWIRRERPDVK